MLEKNVQESRREFMSELRNNRKLVFGVVFLGFIGVSISNPLHAFVTEITREYINYSFMTARET